jgi:transposase
MRLTDEQWAVIQPLLPPPSPALRGRPPLDERAVLDGIFWKLSTLSPWYDLPPDYPSFQTCYRRYIQWQRLGLLKTIQHALLIDLRDRGAVDLWQIRSNGPIHLVVDGSVLKLCVDPSLKNSWQLSTAMLFIAPIIKRLKQEMFHRFGTGLYTRAHHQENQNFANIRHEISEMRTDVLDALQANSAASLEEEA